MRMYPDRVLSHVWPPCTALATRQDFTRGEIPEAENPALISSPSPGGGVPSGAHFRDFLSLNITWSENWKSLAELEVELEMGASLP